VRGGAVAAITRVLMPRARALAPLARQSVAIHEQRPCAGDALEPLLWKIPSKARSLALSDSLPLSHTQRTLF